MITHIIVKQKDLRLVSPLDANSKTAFLENDDGTTIVAFVEIDGKPAQSFLETPFQQIADAMIAAGLAIDATKDNISKKISNNDAAIDRLRKILKTNDDELSAIKDQLRRTELSNVGLKSWNVIAERRIKRMERVALKLYRDGNIGKADLEAFGIVVDQDGSSS